MSQSPYSNLPASRYWRTGVVEQHPLAIADLYRKKFAIERSDRIATAGSCFAQHIARQLRQRGCNVLDVEPAPEGLPTDVAQSFGYAMYSARYGNIYTARQLVQLLTEAFDQPLGQDMVVWEKNGRFYDAQRPAVEPEGHATPDRVMAHRAEHLDAVRRLFSTTDVMIFTLGLTETWRRRDSGVVYPTAPGTVAGTFDPDLYEFVNFTAAEVLEDVKAARAILHRVNPSMKFLFTVSPVPLTATAADMHVLLATTYSKSVLRAVCGELVQAHDDIDYFPSYEIISSPVARGFFFETNLRSVAIEGVDVVMRTFFEAHDNLAGEAQPAATDREAKLKRRAERAERGERPGKKKKKGDVVCEEALLDAFAR